MTKDQQEYLLGRVPSRHINREVEKKPKQVLNAERICEQWHDGVRAKADLERKKREARINEIREVIYIRQDAEKALAMIVAMEREDAR